MCLGFWKLAPSCKHTGTIIGFLTYCLGSRRRYRDRNVAGFLSVQLWRVRCKIYFFVKILNKSFSTFITNVVNNFCVRWNIWPRKVLRMTFLEWTTSYYLWDSYSAGHIRIRSHWACSCFLIGQSIFPASYRVPEPSCPSKWQCGSRMHENNTD